VLVTTVPNAVHRRPAMTVLSRVLASHRTDVEAAGFEAGDGFIKLPHDRTLPTKLMKSLMKARVLDYEA